MNLQGSTSAERGGGPGGPRPAPPSSDGVSLRKQTRGLGPLDAQLIQNTSGGSRKESRTKYLMELRSHPDLTPDLRPGTAQTEPESALSSWS